MNNTNKKTKSFPKYLAFAAVCNVIALAFGLQGEQKPELPLWSAISILTSTFTLMGLSSGIVLLGRGMAKCCHGTDKGWRMALDIALSGVYAAAIPYCILWIVAECVWLKNFGFTRDPILLSIGIVVIAMIATGFVIEPEAYKTESEEDAPPRKPHIALRVIEWVLVVAMIFWGVIPFLNMQGRRNWRIVTRPESFAGTREPACKAEGPARCGKVAPRVAMPMAGSFVFPKVPESIYADRENSIYQKINTLSGPRRIAFSIECNCYSNNAFRIWTGRDADGDGKLSIQETDTIFGWNAGRWMLENFAKGERAMYPAKSVELRQRIEVRFEIDGDGACTRIELLANGKPLAPSEQLEKFRSEHASKWDIIRLVRNGISAPEELTTMTVVRQ